MRKERHIWKDLYILHSSHFLRVWMACLRQMYHEQNHKGLRVVSQLCSHGETPENCTVCGHQTLVSQGSGWDRDRCYKQEPDLKKASAVEEMANNVDKKRGSGIIRVRERDCLNLRFKRWCGIMRSLTEGGIWSMCKDMWKTFPGLTGRDLWVQGDWRDRRSRYHVRIWWMCCENEDDKVYGVWIYIIACL